MSAISSRRSCISWSACENQTVNIGAGEDHTIRDFARMICETVGLDAKKIQYDTGRYVGARSKCLKIEKLRTLVPHLQYTPLARGLSETISWMEQEPQILLGSGPGAL